MNLKVGGLVVTTDAAFNRWRDQLVTQAAGHAMPTIYGFREFTEAGGLISYGPDFADVYREVGIYVGRILQGAEARNLPVQQPTKFELVVNLKAARAIGLTIPPTLLARADEVIE